MYRQFYQGMSMTDLPLFALLLFFAIFTAVAVWVLLFRRSQDYEAISRLPLAEQVATLDNSRTSGGSHER